MAVIPIAPRAAIATVPTVMRRLLRMMSGALRAGTVGQPRGLGGLRGFHGGAGGLGNRVGGHRKRRRLALLLELLRHVAGDVHRVFAGGGARRLGGGGGGRSVVARGRHGRRSGDRRLRGLGLTARRAPFFHVLRGVTRGGHRGRRGCSAGAGAGAARLRRRFGGLCGGRLFYGRRGCRRLARRLCHSPPSCRASAPPAARLRLSAWSGAPSALRRLHRVAIRREGGLRFGARLGRRAAAFRGSSFGAGVFGEQRLVCGLGHNRMQQNRHGRSAMASGQP